MNVEPGKEWIVAEEKVTKENQIIEASEIKQVSSASPEDIRYMKEAIRQAKKAAALGDVPIGCVIVYQDKIIGRGYNRRMADKTVLAHAEIIAMRKACKKMATAPGGLHDVCDSGAVSYVRRSHCAGTDSQSGHWRLNPKAGAPVRCWTCFTKKASTTRYRPTSTCARRNVPVCCLGFLRIFAKNGQS